MVTTQLHFKVEEQVTVVRLQRTSVSGFPLPGSVASCHALRPAPPSSNPACGFPALGSPGNSRLGHTQGAMFKNQLVELVSVEKSDKLTKQGCISYHDFALPFLGFRLVLPPLWSLIGSTFSINSLKTVFGQEWFSLKYHSRIDIKFFHITSVFFHQLSIPS